MGMLWLLTSLPWKRGWPNGSLSAGCCEEPSGSAIRGSEPLARCERHAVEEYGPLARALASLRRIGMRIAVDDAGAGFASIRHILQLAPDLIELDRDVIARIDTDPARQALGTAMAGFAAGVGASLVAEGIETAGELSMVTALGMHAGQGYFLGRPSVNSEDWARWVRLPPADATDAI